MAFNFFQKKKPLGWNGALLKTDVHSHLLPGIDDGAADMEAAVQLIRGLQSLGYSGLITTPHIRWDQFRNTPDIIRRRLNLVQEELQKREIDIALHAAAEYFLDDHLAELVKAREPLLTLKDKLVLVEFPLLHSSPHVKQSLFDLQMGGYQPVIAHPERYVYLHKRYELLHTCKENGCLFQMNLYSAFGGYGKIVGEIANYLLEHDFYDFIGTDLHHIRQLERLRQLPYKPALEKLIGSGRLLNDRLIG